MAKKDNNDQGITHNTKRCWNCHTHLPIEATRCTYCGTKVCEINKHGVARKPFDWKSYAISVLSIIGLCVFVWWAFLRDR